MQTVDINGKAFAAEQSGTDRDGRVKYTLRKIGGRGLAYDTMRNAKDSALLFCVNPNSYKLPGIWLREIDGRLEQVKVI